jgi:hypothetical protein
MESLIFVWMPDTNGVWRPVEVPVEHYQRIVALSVGPHGDDTVSTVQMPEPRKTA